MLPLKVQETPEFHGTSDIVAAVEAILSWPDEALDYGKAKLALDALVDPTIDSKATMAELDRMAKVARRMSGPGADTNAKLAALRRLIYKSGPWNDWRPFDYDHTNVRGANVRVKLIAHYLRTRHGDCVSMPVLFLILAEKLGVEMALVSAPQHWFLRYEDESGRTIDLEPTSGAEPQSYAWIRHVHPISERAIATGLHLRTLPRREGIAAMASTVLQFLMDSRRYEEAAALTGVILACNPRDGLILANRERAYLNILRQEFCTYAAEFLVPLHLQPRWRFLWARSYAAFATAQALGWQPRE